MEIDQITLKTLLGKLNQPVHITYIARYILKQEVDVTKRVMDKLIKDNLVEESRFGKEYYVVKNP
jgi:hypothetical protein